MPLVLSDRLSYPQKLCTLLTTPLSCELPLVPFVLLCGPLKDGSSKPSMVRGQMDLAGPAGGGEGEGNVEMASFLLITF